MMRGRLTLRDVVKTFELPTIDASASVREAAEIMIEKDCYSLLVPRKSRHDAYGIITKKDILSYVIAQGKDLAEVEVKDVMSKPLVILTNLSLDLRWVARAMANSGVSTMAVFEKGDFYGYATESAILEGVYNAMRRAKIEEGVEFVSC